MNELSEFELMGVDGERLGFSAQVSYVCKTGLLSGFKDDLLSPYHITSINTASIQPPSRNCQTCAALGVTLGCLLLCMMCRTSTTNYSDSLVKLAMLP